MLHLKNYTIKIPKNINLILCNNILTIKGPLGTRKLLISNNIFLNKNKTHLIITEKSLVKMSFTKNKKTLQSTTVSVINFVIYGLRFGFDKQLVIVGVGYKAYKEKESSFLNLKLGYSHLIKIKIPNNLIVSCPKPTLINIFGISKSTVNEFASKIRSLKSPEPYKGKGIKYFDEIIIKKEGKRS